MELSNLMNGIVSLLDAVTNCEYSKFLEKNTIEAYKKYIGSDSDLEELIQHFKNVKFGEEVWKQVLTSRTTLVSGSGLGSSSVRATYILIDGKPDTFTVLNQSINESLESIFIRGESASRDITIPTCRTVYFPSIGVTGDYWISYVSRDSSTIIVVSPLIILGTSIAIPSFCYVLTKLEPQEFWKNKNLVEEIKTASRKLGLTNFLNKPLPTALSLEPSLDESIESTSPIDQFLR